MNWKRSTLAVASAAILLTGSASCADEVVLVRAGRPAATIVLPKDPIAAEVRGASELRDHFKEMSGAELPIAKAAPGDGATIRLVHDSALGPEEYRLKTDGRNLLISGGRPRGVMYGCTALLERLGVRWFTAAVQVVPQRATIALPALDERGTPAFDYRHPYFNVTDDADWAARNRINGASKRLDAARGGSVRIEPFVHSFDQIVPAELFDTHPEYFPEFDGKRAAGIEKGGKVYSQAVQRCLSNSEVVKLAIAKVGEWQRQTPDAQLISVSQNDGDGWCTCATCRTLEKKHGGKSGVLIRFVNQVAAAHPERTIDTLAYGETESPPQAIVPRRNVRIRLCPIKVCHAHPLEQCSSTESRRFLENLKGWDAITESLNVWHYNAPFAHELMPFPDFKSFPIDLRLYRKHGARGVFCQGVLSPGGADAELRAWVMARLLWNPEQDADALVTEWMKGVYGAAWAPLKEWFDRQQREFSDASRHLLIGDGPLHAAFSAELLAAGDALFEKAEKDATGKSVAAVAKARLALRYVKLERSKIPGPDLESFVDDARRFGVTQIADGRPLDDWAAELRKRRR